MPLDLRAHAKVFMQSPFAEELEYWPKGGTPRRIIAVVDRQFIRTNPETGEITGPFIVIETPNTDEPVGCTGASGIRAAEFQRGVDQVKIALREDGSPELRPLRVIVSQDPGMVRLEVG